LKRENRLNLRLVIINVRGTGRQLIKTRYQVQEVETRIRSNTTDKNQTLWIIGLYLIFLIHTGRVKKVARLNTVTSMYIYTPIMRWHRWTKLLLYRIGVE